MVRDDGGGGGSAAAARGVAAAVGPRVVGPLFGHNRPQPAGVVAVVWSWQSPAALLLAFPTSTNSPTLRACPRNTPLLPLHVWG